MNEVMSQVFALNHNFAAYNLEKQLNANLNFMLYDQNTVAQLIKKEPMLLPPKRVMPAKDMRWNMKQFSREVTQGILMGESIGKLANRVQNVTNANRVGAIRAARTAITGAECAGRMESYRRAKKMGITLQKEWLATLDGRTRHEHRILDGQKVDEDKPFNVGGVEIMYPGDPSAPAHLVYNCRCTVIAAVDGVTELDPVYRRDGETGKPIEDMSYEEWVKEKSVQISGGRGADDYATDKGTVNSKNYKEKFSGLTGSSKTDKAAYRYTQKAVLENDGTSNETVYLLNIKNGRWISTTKNSNMGGAVEIPRGYSRNSILLVHNHPNSTVHSFEDIAAINDAEEIGGIIAGGHNGNVFYLAIGEGQRIAQDPRIRYNELERAWSRCVRVKNYDTQSALEEFARDNGWTFEVR